MTDARFEDGAEAPLRLLARDAQDLRVMSALLQDAVLTGADMQFSRQKRRFALLVNRFRWEDEAFARAAGRRFERVRAVLAFSDVVGVAHQDLSRDAQTVLSLLSVEFTPDGDSAPGEPSGPGRVLLTFAGDGALALDVECLEVELSDVTRPYAASAGQAPRHPD